ncbi:MAG: hypothetical protein JST54_18355 [Deltaproteobacteria bacterium]|nr:hypothetical protein [Deltaproteobacteria bacterium]
MAGGKKDLEMLIVQSKIRETVRELDKNMRISDEFLMALNEHVHGALKTFISRADKNGRKTLREYDV